MEIAFYAPLKAPDHPVPSGDRRMAGLLMAALRAAGHDVMLASRLRSYEGQGDAASQAEIRAAGEAEAQTLIERFYDAEPPPQAWFTYHLYHKAPDWLGPTVSRALAIPYVVAEASFAPKQAQGPWTEGHAAVAAALGRAGAVLAVTEDDRAGLRPVVSDGGRIGRRRHSTPTPGRRAATRPHGAVAVDRGHDASRRQARLLPAPGRRSGDLAGPALAVAGGRRRAGAGCG
jgi:hypothetical protein